MHSTDLEKLKARKDHTCTWCNRKIEKGSVYHRWATFDDA